MAKQKDADKITQPDITEEPMETQVSDVQPESTPTGNAAKILAPTETQSEMASVGGAQTSAETHETESGTEMLVDESGSNATVDVSPTGEEAVDTPVAEVEVVSAVNDENTLQLPMPDGSIANVKFPFSYMTKPTSTVHYNNTIVATVDKDGTRKQVSITKWDGGDSITCRVDHFEPSEITLGGFLPLATTVTADQMLEQAKAELSF